MIVGAIRAEAGFPVQADQATEALVDSLIRAAIDHVYSGRLDLGLETTEIAGVAASRDPRESRRSA